MNKLQALREKIANLAKQANHLLNEKGDQPWTTEDQTKFDNLTKDINACKSEMKAIEEMRDLEADEFFNVNPAQRNGQKEEVEAVNAMNAVALYLRHGNNVTAEQAIAIRNAMSTTTPAEGGYTVPAQVSAMVIDRLKEYGGMRDVAEILTSSNGQSWTFPTSDGTAETGAIVGQNTAPSVGDITFGNVALNVFSYTSLQIALPLELIQDSAIDVIDFVVSRLATRIARKQNTDFTVGGGTTLPDGIVPRASSGKVGTTGQTLTVIYDDLVDLKHSVNRAYRKNAKFMLNDLSVAVISKIKDTTGRPIWVPGVSEGITNGTPDTLLGFPVVTNDDVAAMAASAKSIVFGDLSKYIIRDVTNTTSIKRFDDSAFALKNQVGFCGWQRSGGQLVDVNAVKYYQNSAS